MDKLTGTAVEAQVQGWVGDIEYTHRIANRGALQAYRQNLLVAPNLSTIILSNVNLTVCIHHSKRVTLRLMLLDGRCEQLSLEFLHYNHEPNIPGLNVVVGVAQREAVPKGGDT